MSVNVFKNGQLQRVAGKSVMDADFNTTSRNGLQNRIITAFKNAIEGRVTALENATWTYLGEYSANTNIDLPSAWHEISFIVKPTAGAGYTLGQETIPNSADLPYNSDVLQFQGGFFLISANAGGYNVELSNNKLNLKGAWTSGSEITSTAKIYVYYR